MRSILHTGEVIRPMVFSLLEGKIKGINLGVAEYGYNVPIVTVSSAADGDNKAKVIEIDSQRAREYGFRIVIK